MVCLLLRRVPSGLMTLRASRELKRHTRAHYWQRNGEACTSIGIHNAPVERSSTTATGSALIVARGLATGLIVNRSSPRALTAPEVPLGLGGGGGSKSTSMHRAGPRLIFDCRACDRQCAVAPVAACAQVVVTTSNTGGHLARPEVARRTKADRPMKAIEDLWLQPVPTQQHSACTSTASSPHLIRRLRHCMARIIRPRPSPRPARSSCSVTHSELLVRGLRKVAHRGLRVRLAILDVVARGGVAARKREDALPAILLDAHEALVTGVELKRLGSGEIVGVLHTIWCSQQSP